MSSAGESGTNPDGLGVGRARSDDDEGATAGKLFPEWSVAADDQVVLAGLIALAALLLAWGWTMWFNGDDSSIEAVAPVSTVVESVTDETTTTVADATTTTAATSSTTSTPSTSSASTTAQAVIGDVQAAVDPLAGAVTGTNNGAVAVLTGYVANEAERAEAEQAAGAVEGIEQVENNLELLEPAVLSTLEDQGVTGADVSGVGTEMTVSGTIDSEDVRQTVLDAAAAVPGVTGVVDDRLEVSVTADLNALPQVQFATGSDQILEQSFGDLDTAAELVQEAGEDVSLEIQGYTDIRGDEQANLELSQARADAVRTYLVSAGVSEDLITAVGYGETQQFAEGESDEALAANRLVRFEQLG